jgi:ABC-type polysaccharide/polyol phosphate export permease
MYAYLEAVWKCRHFWISLVRMDLRSRYRGSLLGIGWSLLHPLLMTAILCTVFSTVFKQNLAVYAPFLFTGFTFWNFIVAVSVQGCQCFLQGESYIRQFPAPMAIYPLRTVLGAMFHFLISLGLVIVVTLVFRGRVAPLPLLSLVATLVLLLLLGWCLALLFGVAHVLFRDTSHLSEIAFQILFYATPVIYPPDMLEGKRLGMLMNYNPTMPFLKLLRQPILDGTVPSLSDFTTACLMVFVLISVTVAVLRYGEHRLIFHL